MVPAQCCMVLLCACKDSEVHDKKPQELAFDSKSLITLYKIL